MELSPAMFNDRKDNMLCRLQRKMRLKRTILELKSKADSHAEFFKHGRELSHEILHHYYVKDIGRSPTC